ncbi:MAG: hypothetical protein DI528_12985 [Shinella sp.]|nr:MAG: hypothetical protein DI528_12985 [Shinella sp.]
MITLAELQEFRDKLIKARAGGLKRAVLHSPVMHQEVEFRTDSELAAALADVERRIAAILGGAPRIVNIQGVKGYRR